ncbi:carbohydrate-binding protein, partial [Nonomuraea cavernae]
TSTPGGTWKAGTAYAVGSQVTYAGLTYRCIQAHTALTGWEPPNVPALWQRL